MRGGRGPADPGDGDDNQSSGLGLLLLDAMPLNKLPPLGVGVVAVPLLEAERW